MRELMDPLSVREGLLWLLIPAGLQWLILHLTRERMREFRLILLAPVCYALCAILGAVFLLALCAFALLLLFSLLLQADCLDAVGGSLQFAGMLLCSKSLRCTFGRLGLCAAGWGLGWAFYRHMGTEVY